MAINVGKNSPLWNTLRHVIIPFLFVTGIPIFGFSLMLFPLDGGIAANYTPSVLTGNKFSWVIVSLFIAWCVVSLKIPSKTFAGPTTSFNFTPVYVANGFFFYCSSMLLFLLANVLSPNLSAAIYDHMPHIIGTLNIIALILCLFLWFRGRNKTKDPVLRKRFPFIFEFYRGMELHPTIFNMDVKQLVNCRVGLGLWLLLPLSFLVTSFQRNGFNSGILVNVLLQNIYLAKFYWWETGYFNTLDITLDRAGFYLSWGCLNFVPSFYTFSTYYQVSHPTDTSAAFNLAFFILGLLAIALNYKVDREKELFIETKGKCKIWGKPAKCIEANYQGRPVRLIVSGFWGTARHINYVFELLLALFWNLTCYQLGIIPFMYNIFLTILLVHRIYRDEDKCQNKYGPYWKQYCKTVAYRMIPYIY